MQVLARRWNLAHACRLPGGRRGRGERLLGSHCSCPIRPALIIDMLLSVRPPGRLVRW